MTEDVSVSVALLELLDGVELLLDAVGCVAVEPLNLRLNGSFHQFAGKEALSG